VAVGWARSAAVAEIVTVSSGVICEVAGSVVAGTSVRSDCCIAVVSAIASLVVCGSNMVVTPFGVGGQTYGEYLTGGRRYIP